MDFHPFVEEVDANEITLLQVVGKGSFGTVRKGKWKDKDVAVKVIETEQEKNAFLVEVRQLSRVCHPNIVKFYGASTGPPMVCLVMEYAEGGSLYNVLHQQPQPHYTAAHAISWALQCASGIAYLHNMKPKALIHRDLKPPNLLLIMGGTVLKICDFGTACDLQTVMTNSKGSAAWMAPEVFESCNYSEKCDVFSWGVILWQILTRRKPFNEIGGPAFRIMWAVHSGTRPPLIQGCPKPLESLMTRCWDKNPSLRPSMLEVEVKLRKLSIFFHGAGEPITFAPSHYYDNEGVEDSSSDAQNIDGNTGNDMNSLSSHSSTCLGTSIIPSQGSFVLPPLPLIIRPSRTSAPASLSSSIENLPRTDQDKDPLVKGSDPNKRRSADLTTIFEQKTEHKKEHRRTGSCGTPMSKEVSSSETLSKSTDELHSLSSKDLSKPILNLDTKFANRKASWPSTSTGSNSGDETPDLSQLNAYLLLEPNLQPLPPTDSCQESQELFELHRRMAQEFLQVKTEIALLTQRKENLDKELGFIQQRKPQQQIEEHMQLQSEKESLLKFRHKLKKQLQLIKAQHQPSKNKNSDEWVMV